MERGGIYLSRKGGIYLSAKVSDIAGVQRSQLTRLFKQDTGMSPHRYVLEMKMNRARQFLMTNTEYPGSVALELGFHDYAHFYRTFKKMTGMPPSQYVKKYGKYRPSVAG